MIILPRTYATVPICLMICYKGNSFFRNIKILFKYFVKKAKIPFKDNCIFYKKTLKFYYFFVQKTK
jgi:hypothetical protein